MKRIFKCKRIEPIQTAPPELLPLTPVYDEKQHRVYFDAIEAALTGKHSAVIKNIALTGSYGVGKSSVLQEVATAHANQVVQISLSTLGRPDKDSYTPANSVTNRIQKEIVKQLLYREDPDKTPGSRFRRISGFNAWRGLWISLLASLVFTTAFFLVGWTSKLDLLLASHVDFGLWLHSVLFVTFTVVVFVLKFLGHNRLHIQSLQAGYATITLSNDTQSYFDQYLDEIVYFFEVTRRDIVIFEDIDRFDDPHIFETLRSLNSLLNGARQLGSRNIRFIYAIKDSIFDELGNRAVYKTVGAAQSDSEDSVEAEVARANRTKFFDVVVPVVPFITHRSARDLMKRTLASIEHNISDHLFDLAARHVVDMRLILNARNEFIIFRNRVLNTDNGNLALNENSLFAMMLYKSTHLSDFERIKSGNSKLDELYQDFRNIVIENISRLRIESVSIGRQLTSLDSLANRSENLGHQLVEYLTIVSGQLSHMVWNQRTVKFAGRSWSEEELRSPDFWQKLTQEDQDSAITAVFFDQNSGRNIQFVIQRPEVSQIVHDQLVTSDWAQTDRAKLLAREAEIKAETEFLSHADMHDLVEREAYTLSTGDSLKTRSTRLGSKMAQQLVVEGYINRDFTLYTSTYYSERVSTQAQNFLIHHVNPNIADPYFQLQPSDVESILRERGVSVLAERAMYNIGVLNYLLDQEDERTDRIVKSLSGFNSQEREFLTIYLTEGAHTNRLLRRLTSLSDEILVFIMDSVQLEPVRADLINQALSSLVDEREYLVSEDLRAFIEANFQTLPTFTRESTGSDLAARVMAVLVAMGARLATLAPLGEPTRKAAIASGCYRITMENLSLALGSSDELALDQIRDSNPVVYRFLLEHLPEYLDLIHTTDQLEFVIASEDSIVAVLADVIEAHEPLLARVLEFTAPTCRVQDLAELSPSAWTALVESHRIPTSYSNVVAFIGYQGQIDSHLASLLKSTTSIQVSEEVSEEDKASLAYQVLEAKDLGLNHDTRIKLLLSLGLSEFLDPSRIQPENGRLVGLLIEEEVIEDTAQSFELALSLDWNSREFAISKSKQFASFMTPAEVPSKDIPALMKSNRVPRSVKVALISRIDEFLPTDDQRALKTVAEFAIDKQETVSPGMIARIARAGVAPHHVTRLLRSHLPTMSAELLSPLLRSMDEPYSLVAERSRKRPRLPDTEDNRALLERLIELEVVSSFKVEGEELAVNLKMP